VRRKSQIDNKDINMKGAKLACSVVAFFCLGFAATVLAAQPAATGTVAAVKPAKKCLNDLHAFDNQMEKEGY
jgi:hypothetical protein